MIALELPKQSTTHFGSYSRMLAADPNLCHYVNKPFEFKRYGPVVALVGAGLSIGAGMSILSSSALLGGLMIAGGIASGLGALTGNKFLSTLGMGLGLAGTIGGSFFTADGVFTAPFSEGYSFANTATGEMFSKFSKNVTSLFGGGGAGTSTAGQTLTSDIVSQAKGGLTAGVDLPGGGINLTGSSLANPVTDAASSLTAHLPAADVAQTAVGAAPAATGGGWFDKLSNSSSLLNFAGGIAKNIQDQPKIDAEVDWMKAKTGETNYGVQAAKDKVTNMQFQNTGNLPSGSGAQLASTRPAGTAGTHAVIDPSTGMVVMLNDAQFLAYTQQNQQPQALSGGGLLRQGVPA